MQVAIKPLLKICQYLVTWLKLHAILIPIGGSFTITNSFFCDSHQ